MQHMLLAQKLPFLDSELFMALIGGVVYELCCRKGTSCILAIYSVPH